MYHTMDEFHKDYDQLTEGTGKMIAAMTDEMLSQAVVPGHLTLGQIAWHLVATVPEMMSRTGLGLSAVDDKAPPPQSAAEVVAGYGKATAELKAALKSNWTDEGLQEVIEMYGQKWPRSMTLSALIHHEIHHRGQMTVLLRQAGAKVPGLYGPAKEEWTQYGMEEPAY